MALHPRTDQSCVPTHLAEVQHLKNFMTPGSVFEITFKTKGIFGFNRVVCFQDLLIYFEILYLFVVCMVYHNVG